MYILSKLMPMYLNLIRFVYKRTNRLLTLTSSLFLVQFNSLNFLSASKCFFFFLLRFKTYSPCRKRTNRRPQKNPVSVQGRNRRRWNRWVFPIFLAADRERMACGHSRTMSRIPCRWELRENLRSTIDALNVA